MTVVRWIVLLALALMEASGQRVVFVSLDGLSHRLLTRDAAGQELRTVHETARRGVMAEGVQTAFPSTTANSHAAIWTGCYGDANGIPANNPPLGPRSEHTFLERGNGFYATGLTAEPFWVTAARQGKRAVAHQPTQGYPFRPLNTHKGAVVVNGYQTKLLAPHRLFRRGEAERLGPSSFLLRHGPLELVVSVEGGGLVLSERGGANQVRVAATPVDGEWPRGRGLARRFSDGLIVHKPVPAMVYFRAFEVMHDDFRLYVSPLHELGLHDGEREAPPALHELLREAGGFLGNGPAALLNAGLVTGEEYLEVVELVVRQMTRHAAWLNERYRPDLLQTYLPFPDEFDHSWLGLDEAGSAQHKELRRRGYAIVDRAAEEFAKLARPEDTLLWISDHGMAAVQKSVSVGRVLRDAGLGQDISYVYNSLLINSTEWKAGRVKPEERAAVVDRAIQALSAVKDPQTGANIFRAFYTPERDGVRFGIRREAGLDLYFDLAPGWAASGRDDSPPTVNYKEPRGVHGFMPLREDMLAILVARGPRFEPGLKWPMLKTVQFAPLVSALLGIDPPRNATGVSPLAIRSSERKQK